MPISQNYQDADCEAVSGSEQAGAPALGWLLGPPARSCSPYTLPWGQSQCWARRLTTCAHFQDTSLFMVTQPSSGAALLHPIY